MFLSKHSSKIIIGLMALAVAASVLMTIYSDELTQFLGGSKVRMEYETELFDNDEVIDINIEIDEDTWDDMINNALNEEYYVCNVLVNGRRINNVAIRLKGNMSLAAIDADPDTDRHSFKLEFDHFVDGQTCFGLDKLILNNNYADATNMKEAIVYDMYRFLGADASLSNYAKVRINGEYWGVYLAIEAVEDSFMLRNFGTQDGELYKPEASSLEGTEFESEIVINQPGMMGAPVSNSDFGSSLNYTDDSPDSYPAIWASEITATNDSDHRRVVTAIKNVNEGTELDRYLDVDNILRYMAVHAFSVNMDSLSSNMTHNYYLYEYDGKLNIFPWDYNLAFGGMAMGGSFEGTILINDAIDTPFSGTEFFDALLENEEYRDQYHAYLQMLVDEYVNGGKLDEFYSRIHSQIDSLVETDPTAFYTYEEYLAATDILYNMIKLRAESIDGQIKGTIPSTDEGQRDDYSLLVDGTSIDLAAMGHIEEDADLETEGNAPVFGVDGNDQEGPMPPPADADGDVSDGTDETAPQMGMFDPDNPPEGVETDPDNPPDMPPIFDPNNPPDGEEFDPDNMPQPIFDPNNPPDMEGYDPENMPEMPVFDPDNPPEMIAPGETVVPDETTVPDEIEAEETETEASEPSETSEETAASETGHEENITEETSSDDADIPDEVTLSVTTSEFGFTEMLNGTVYLALLWLMLVAVFLVTLIKRRGN